MGFALAAALGAALAYFFDPQNGRGRRAKNRDRLAGALRSGRRRAGHAGRGVAAEAYGAKQKLVHRKEEPKVYNDVTLARKVESEIFRDRDAPKGAVDVNVEDGVVYLRGEVERPELIDDLLEKARKVQGVVAVESLLHTPGSEAPTKGS
jgi:osmotically-inducible protein OsmY